MHDLDKAIRAAMMTAHRYARGGYADGGGAESVLMRERQAITPSSLARAWTPPEEAIAADLSPRASEFMQTYPEKLSAGIASGVAAAPAAIAHGVTDPFVLARQAYEGQLPPDYFHSDEGIGRALNAAGLVQTGAMPLAANVAKKAAQKGETMLGSAGGTLYHGSPVKDLTELNPSARGPLGPGTYATPDPINIAKRYAGEEGQVYQLPNKEMDIFRGSGHRTDAEYAGFKNDKQRLIDAVEPEMQNTVVPMIEKMWSGDGYPLYWGLRKAYGGDEGAQNLFKRAKFEGLSGQVDGPETVIFKKVPLKAEPQMSVGPSPMEAAQEMANKAVQTYGTTHNIAEAGYILPNGKMLDFSGRHQARYNRVGDKFAPKQGERDWLANDRAVDHRDVVHMLAGPEGMEGHEGMAKFMAEAGAIRNKPGIGFEAAAIPTDRQIKTIVTSHNTKYRGEPLVVELSRPTTGDIIASRDFERPNVEAIQKWFREQSEANPGVQLAPKFSRGGKAPRAFSPTPFGPEAAQRAVQIAKQQAGRR